MKTTPTETTPPPTMPYWTPAGIVMDEPPPAYAAAMAAPGSDWEGPLKEHGYRPNGNIGSECALIDVAIWEHEDGHRHKDFTTQEAKNMLKTEQTVAILLLSHRAHFAKN